MGFTRQECWSELPFPSAGDLLDPGWILYHWTSWETHTLTCSMIKKKRLQWLQNNALRPGQSKVRSLASKEMDSYHAESVIKRWATETWLIKMKRRNQGLFPSGWQELQGRGVKSALCWKEELGKKREISIQHKTSSILDILNLEIPVRHPSGAIE